MKKKKDKVEAKGWYVLIRCSNCGEEEEHWVSLEIVKGIPVIAAIEATGG